MYMARWSNDKALIVGSKSRVSFPRSFMDVFDLHFSGHYVRLVYWHQVWSWTRRPEFYSHSSLWIQSYNNSEQVMLAVANQVVHPLRSVNWRRQFVTVIML